MKVRRNTAGNTITTTEVTYPTKKKFFTILPFTEPSAKLSSDAKKGTKSPMSLAWEGLAVPDLAEYFNTTTLIGDDLAQIAVCRTYANYLASLRPKLARKSKK